MGFIDAVDESFVDLRDDLLHCSVVIDAECGAVGGEDSHGFLEPQVASGFTEDPVYDGLLWSIYIFEGGGIGFQVVFCPVLSGLVWQFEFLLDFDPLGHIGCWGGRFDAGDGGC